jgi:hypothetical protein
MTPTLAILALSARTVAVTDKRGRRFVIRRPTAIDTLRLFKAAGPVLSLNEPWLAMAGLAATVIEIDGIPVPAPFNEAQIEALIERLGDDGLAAIVDSVEDVSDDTAAESHVGNLLGTPC